MNDAATPTPISPLRRALRYTAIATIVGGYSVLSTCSPPETTLSQVRQLGVLRVATVNSPTTYYEGPAGPTGFEYDLAKGLADRLGVTLETVLAPTPGEALKLVRQKKVHIAAAGIGISPARTKSVRFTQPVLTVVPQLVYRNGQARPRNLGDLHGRLRVTQGSVHAERLREIRKTQFADLAWEETSDQEIEELLHMVANEQLHYTIANSDIVAINQRYYPQLRVAFAIADSVDLAWALPLTNDDSLYTEATEYLREISGAELARLRDRHFGHIEQVGYVGAVTLATHVESRLPKFREAFEAAAQKYGLDWRLVAAMGYQESHWDPAAVSPTGVRGLMQLTMATAAFLNVADREDPVQSIWGGARYFDQIHSQLPPEIAEPDRTWMALAAYNMGIGHLLDARGLTKSLGGDPNRWLDVRNTLPLLTQPKHYSKLKFGYARGYEAVSYVGNVRTYFDMLVWITGGGAPPKEESGEAVPPQEDRPPPKDPLNINSPVL